ncbi:hypothetical protein PR048_006055 [Dryococelus australis]|uniref:Ribosomal protein S3 n=1 Tax=Dryococelus australis TaxID=614101 RepID=A0ABQ9I9X4_9NEOP|nr:hypothetical protein PR048_006055 [Dryococelus australis]
MNWVQSPVGSPDFRIWETCRTMPLVGGFSQGSPVSPTLQLRRHSILTSITPIGSQNLAVDETLCLRRRIRLDPGSPARLAERAFILLEDGRPPSGLESLGSCTRLFYCPRLSSSSDLREIQRGRRRRKIKQRPSPYMNSPSKGPGAAHSTSSSLHNRRRPSAACPEYRDAPRPSPLWRSRDAFFPSLPPAVAVIYGAPTPAATFCLLSSYFEPRCCASICTKFISAFEETLAYGIIRPERTRREKKKISFSRGNKANSFLFSLLPTFAEVKERELEVDKLARAPDWQGISKSFRKWPRDYPDRDVRGEWDMNFGVCREVNGLNVPSTAKSLETVQFAQGRMFLEGLGKNQPWPIPAFTLSNFGKPWKTEIRIAGLRIESGSSRMRVQMKRGEYGSLAECKGGVKGEILRKPADQWHSRARFPPSEHGNDPTGNRNWITLVGGKNASHCVT